MENENMGEVMTEETPVIEEKLKEFKGLTNNEVVNCVNFFTTVGRVKKVLKSWKKMAGV